LPLSEPDKPPTLDYHRPQRRRRSTGGLSVASELLCIIGVTLVLLGLLNRWFGESILLGLVAFILALVPRSIWLLLKGYTYSGAAFLALAVAGPTALVAEVSGNPDATLPVATGCLLAASVLSGLGFRRELTRGWSVFALVLALVGAVLVPLFPSLCRFAMAGGDLP
jgi:hypothetical protein